MIVRVLAENTSFSEDFASEHGLCLYIETTTSKILFDTGASGLFAENAEKMGVDLAEVDVVVLSHGHYDHGGGLKTFFELNKRARVYLQQTAFEPHFSRRAGGEIAYIGLDTKLLPNERFIYCGEYLDIDSRLELFSGVVEKRFSPYGNKNLLIKSGDSYVLDDFSHEQNLIIKADAKTLLIAGCAHKGIVNIIDRFKEQKGSYPDYVIGGFHLYSRGANASEAPSVVNEIGMVLLNTRSHFYTCHCTGTEAFVRLKNIMGNNIQYISTGEVIEIDM